MGYNTKKVLEELQNLKDTQKYFYDRNSKPLKPLEIGDTVRFQDSPSKHQEKWLHLQKRQNHISYRMEIQH